MRQANEVLAGATQKALSRGIPVCVVPFGRDQLEVAARVVPAGVGMSRPVKKLTATVLHKQVRQARKARSIPG